MSKVEMLSPRPVDECMARLRTSIASTNSVHGRVAGSSVRLRVTIEYPNGFQPVLSGNFTDHDGGARFQGRVGVPPATIIFMATWVIVLALGGTFSVMKEIGSPKGQLTLVIPIVAALMIGFGAFLIRGSRRLVRDEPQRLIEFVGTAIDATQISRAP